jgi:hypothetical protein
MCGGELFFGCESAIDVWKLETAAGHRSRPASHVLPVVHLNGGFVLSGLSFLLQDTLPDDGCMVARLDGHLYRYMQYVHASLHIYGHVQSLRGSGNGRRRKNASLNWSASVSAWPVKCNHSPRLINCTLSHLFFFIIREKCILDRTISQQQQSQMFKQQQAN